MFGRNVMNRLVGLTIARLPVASRGGVIFQSAAVQEAASSVSTIAMAAEEIEQVAKVTGQGIYDISQALQAVRTEQIKRVPELNTHQTLELFQTDHLLWTWRLRINRSMSWLGRLRLLMNRAISPRRDRS